MTSLPRAASLSLWLNGLLGGAASPDDVLASLDPYFHHVFIGLEDAVLGPLEALGAIRRRISRVAVALPAPGDLIGLAGPASFNAEVVERGEALLLPDAEIGLIPVVVGGAIEWRCSRALPPRPHDPDEARQHLRRVLREVTVELADLQIASWNSEIPDLLLNPSEDPSPPVLPTPHADAVRSAALCLAIVEAARDVEPGAINAAERASFEAAIRRLDSAARGALVAVCSMTSDSLTSP